MPKLKNIIAFQGALGSNSDMACRDAYPMMTALPCQTFAEVFSVTRSDKSQLAMIPIENSVAGRVADIHRLLPGSGLYIIGEHFLRVNFHLFGVESSTLNTITHVHSHIHALPQCSNFVGKRGLLPVVHADTAGAARDIAKWKDPSQGAICTMLAGDLYGLKRLASDIEDSSHNTTRFIVMAKDPIMPQSDALNIMTTFVFRVRNLPAALYKALGGFATNNVNMTKLESYIQGDFVAAQFYADVEGHPDDPKLSNALEELKFFTHSIDILGTYPAHPYRNIEVNDNRKDIQ